MSTVPQNLHPTRSYRTTILLVAVHAALWSAWLLGLFWFMPRWEMIYQDFGLRMPWTTEMVIILTHGVVPAALVVALGFLIVDGAVYLSLRRSGSRWAVRMLWSGLMTVVPMIAILVTSLAVWLAMLKLQEALSK